jgi:hypothetical protein
MARFRHPNFRSSSRHLSCSLPIPKIWPFQGLPKEKPVWKTMNGSPSHMPAVHPLRQDEILPSSASAVSAFPPRSPRPAVHSFLSFPAQKTHRPGRTFRSAQAGCPGFASLPKNPKRQGNEPEKTAGHARITRSPDMHPPAAEQHQGPETAEQRAPRFRNGHQGDDAVRPRAIVELVARGEIAHQ